MTNKTNFSESYRIYFEELNSEAIYLNNVSDLVFGKEIQCNHVVSLKDFTVGSTN